MLGWQVCLLGFLPEQVAPGLGPSESEPRVRMNILNDFITDHY